MCVHDFIAKGEYICRLYFMSKLPCTISKYKFVTSEQILGF